MRLVLTAALALAAASPSSAGTAQAAPQTCVPPAAIPIPTRLAHISVQSIGEGTPVLLIPGLSTPRNVWLPTAIRLVCQHRVLLVQVNGFAGDAPGDNLKPGLLDGVVADLSGYLAQQKLGSVDLIGHSMGGLVGLMLAKAHPEAVRRMMIVDSLPFIGLLFSPMATVPLVEPQARAMRDQMAAAYGQPAAPGSNAAIAARLALKPDSRAKVTAWMAKTDARVSAEALYEDMTTDLRPAMAGIATPITLVYPSDGTPEDRAGATYRAAYKDAPHVTFVPVTDSAHFVMLDQPVAFAAAVDAFLK